MEKAFAMPLFWAGSIICGFVIVWLLSRLFKGKVPVDLYAALNSVLYFALLFNLYHAFSGYNISFITAGVIVICILLRKKVSDRWI